MQYIPIKKSEKNGKETFVIPAIPLKNTNKSVVQKIPHPLGTDSLEYVTLEQAKESVTRAGFSYVLPDGKKGSKPVPKQTITKNENNYEQIILDTLKEKIYSSNANVASSAILALCEFPSIETFDILFNMIGEDNDQLRKNAISGICRYANILTDRIIQALSAPNWVTRNSAITCIINITESDSENIEKFIIPLTKACNDTNTIVQTNALTAIAKVYQKFKKLK